MVWKTAAEIREMDLDNWWGSITIHTPVHVDRLIRFDYRHQRNAARYVLSFRSGDVSTTWKGRTVHIGRMSDGVLELFQYGLRNEGLRHLLFPHTLSLRSHAAYIRDDGRADVLQEPWRSSPDACGSEWDETFIDDDPLQRCRFPHLRQAFLFYVSVDRLRYWVRDYDWTLQRRNEG
jgi:hypothetical protein